jgi:hypothetical protein
MVQSLKQEKLILKNLNSWLKLMSRCQLMNKLQGTLPRMRRCVTAAEPGVR